MKKQILFLRHSMGERLNHWAMAICFILAGLSGLSLFHPTFFWLSAPFGGGTMARILHPFFGCMLALLFLLFFFKIWKTNKIIPADIAWAKQIVQVMQNKDENLPEIGKYNFGQKMLVRTLVVSITLLFVSGLAFWHPWFAPNFTVTTHRVAALVHVFSAFIALCCFIVHVYAAYWTSGSIKAMTQGTVTASWARYHSPGWYQEMIEKSGNQPE